VLNSTGIKELDPGNEWWKKWCSSIPISGDRTMDRLLEENSADMVVDSATLTTLAMWFFQVREKGEWKVPVVIETVFGRNDQRKIVCLNESFLPQKMSLRQKNQFYYNAVLEHLALHRGRGEVHQVNYSYWENSARMKIIVRDRNQKCKGSSCIRSKIEYLWGEGKEQISNEELASFWIHSFLHSGSPVRLVRIDPFRSKVVQVGYLDVLPLFTSKYSPKLFWNWLLEICNKLNTLQDGNYILDLGLDRKMSLLESVPHQYDAKNLDQEQKLTIDIEIKEEEKMEDGQLEGEEEEVIDISPMVRSFGESDHENIDYIPLEWGKKRANQIPFTFTPISEQMLTSKMKYGFCARFYDGKCNIGREVNTIFSKVIFTILTAF